MSPKLAFQFDVDKPNKCITVTREFAATRQAVSKHLRVLGGCDVVSLELRGREIYYHLRSEKMKEIDVWLENFRQLWENRFDQLDDVLENTKERP